MKELDNYIAKEKNLELSTELSLRLASQVMAKIESISLSKPIAIPLWHKFVYVACLAIALLLGVTIGNNYSSIPPLEKSLEQSSLASNDFSLDNLTITNINNSNDNE